ncbi:NAD(P)-dependent alcohol dehydrogenase [Leptolyngbya sp. KIOST-1]|uniref:NAD(P)-dependent alcohol dehydrogenase n=1 Tax=Leptolyngbya sp. KIOST-1 TaxID=1229172 RepID=UPI00056B6417|nr:NAD(P)-dependent alcohol dehydrogenase [Leptolyngbya sp. KIOST-1]
MQINALAALEPGAPLQPFSFAAPPLKPFDCAIKVLACGICHSDLHMIHDDWGQSRYPLVPGHEVIGTVVEVGSQVTHMQKGDRVGVGWQQAACMHCLDCLRGDHNLCDRAEGLIVSGYGGFADHMVVDSRFAFTLPAGLSTESTGPILCGGITVYAGLRNGGMTSGQEVGVIGIGGLGHLAVQFASRLGNRVTVFTTSADKAEFATQLGAHAAILVPPGGSPPLPVNKLNLILNTANQALDWLGYLNYLDSNGTFVFVGIPPEPLTIPVGPLTGKQRRIMGSEIGSPATITEMLQVVEKFGIQPLVETFSLDQANEALQRVKDNKVRYRAVLTM